MEILLNSWFADPLVNFATTLCIAVIHSFMFDSDFARNNTDDDDDDVDDDDDESDDALTKNAWARLFGLIRYLFFLKKNHETSENEENQKSKTKRNKISKRRERMKDKDKRYSSS